MAESSNKVGVFHAIESFLLTPEMTYGIVGDITEGEIQEGYHVHIPLNRSMSVCAKIEKIQDIQFSRFDETHKVLFIRNDEDGVAEVLHCLNVESEPLEITVEGENPTS